MKRKIVSGTMLILLIIITLTLASSVQPVKASETIYIRADGSIEPPTARISTTDNVTYSFTGDIYDSIVVEKDTIVIYGAGYALQGTGSRTGIDLSGRSNVTIKNVTISDFSYGIYLHYSSNIRIKGNKITNNNQYGIWISEYSNDTTMVGNEVTNNSWAGITLNSDNNSISRNNITNDFWAGIILGYSSYNSIVGNDITNNSQYGIMLDSSSHNTIAGNNITDNFYGVFLYESSDNSIYHNDFINNTRQVYDDSWDYPSYTPSINIWNSDYPSGGNYWSDYAGADVDGDGLGDTPYVVDAANQDRYPLMHPWSPLPVHNINTGLGYATIQGAINANETLSGQTIFVEAGTYCENVVVNKTIGLVGEFENITIIDGGGHGSAVSVSASHVSIANFAIINSSREWPGTGSGVRLEHVNDCIIRSNNIANNAIGISLSVSSNNFLYENKILNNWHGIWLDESSNNMVYGNSITANNGNGVWFRYSSENWVSGNNITNSGDESIFFYDSFENWVSGNILTNNLRGIWLYESSNNSISENNIMSNSYEGVVIGGSSGNSVSNNIIANNGYGVHLGSSSGNIISGNSMTANNEDGLWLHTSSNNRISGNNISNNGHDIWLYFYYSFGNAFYNNNFIKNTGQIWSYASTNIWDDGYPLGGNYWSDYNGTDMYRGPYQNMTGSDGIGDTLYVIDSNNMDHYPLMQPWTGLLHDVAVTNVAASRVWVYQGFIVDINVTVLNKGGFDENVVVTLYYNMTANEIVGTQNATIRGRENGTLSLLWDTKGILYNQNYTITAVATIQLDINLTDNTLSTGPITVRILGDINGDGMVTGDDLITAAWSFGAYGTDLFYAGSPPSPRWNLDADINQDLRIDGSDLIVMARNFGK
jgi:parallel beta-helix repeat protein